MDWQKLILWALGPLMGLGIYAGDQRWNQHNDVIVLQLQSAEICQWKIEELIMKIDKLKPGDPLRTELQEQLKDVKRICGRK